MSQKWNLQDIRPANSTSNSRRPKPARPHTNHSQSLRDTIRPKRETSNPDYSTNEDGDEIIPIIDGRKKGRKQLIVAALVVTCVVGASFGISLLTSGAEVTVYPKVRQMTINADITAYPIQQPAELSYEILTLEATGERQVTASGQSEVTTQAQGQITITKTSPGAERLIKNTRFESPNGQIFRIEESVVVPGATGDNPGTVVANVFADEAGEEYNLSSGTRFNVPGFEEGGFTELFNSIYAINQGDITGGFAGPQFMIDDDELNTARQALQEELRDSLVSRVDDERPADFVLFPNAYALTYEQLPAVEYGEDLVTIREVATLQVPLFQRDALAAYIAAQTIVGYNNEPVRINNQDSINFTYSQATTSQSNIANQDSLEFNLAGNPQIVWTFDEEKMKLNLVGMERTALVAALNEYPGLERGEARIRPFWKQSFPKEISKIEIKEVLNSSAQ